MANKKLDEAIGVKPAEDEESLPVVEVSDSELVNVPPKNSPPPTEQDFIDDFMYARQTLHNVIQTGEQALKGALRVARGTEHPRAYEVVSTIIGQVSGAAKDLIALSKMKEDITKGKSEEKNDEETDDKARKFIGSTTDLANLVREIVDKEIEEKDQKDE